MAVTHSGKFVLRLTPPLHEKLAARSRGEGISLNQFCTRILEQGIHRSSPISAKNGPWNKALAILEKKFGDSLLGVVLFGSEARGEARDTSDIDLLIVLSPEASLTRVLYHWWDDQLAEHLDKRVSPHFTRLPQDTEEAGGLWMEVALASTLLWEKERSVSSFLALLRQEMAAGHLRRRLTGGVPYWVRNEK